MGADIHWIMERQNDSGDWEAVCSKGWLIKQLGQAYSQLDWNDPRMLLGDRDYTLFGVLSGVRGTPSGVTEYLAIAGMPPDASEHAKLDFGVTEDIFSGYHSQGYFTLGRLRQVNAAQPPETVPCEDAKEALDVYARAIEALIEGPRAIDLSQVLLGPVDDEPGDGSYPMLRSESNHQRLARISRQNALQPIADDTLRIIVAYGS